VRLAREEYALSAATASGRVRHRRERPARRRRGDRLRHDDLFPAGQRGRLRGTHADVRRQTAHGSGSGSLQCDGSGHFDAFVYPDFGPTFVAGPVDYIATPQGYSLDVYAESTVTGTVRIRR
jgi:hypothetical protein